ncbi:hypothetical protein JMA_02740 [Jeotgalibacillus malaysiensis]|uniref:Uncharacterized protein n=1 Tax=Jeotgalibacillus malaysiensis TaxID=1508404 RepID=A0A0B5AHN8_9BACL|nr:hypothetical protein [Jeotgalibacillus malaysiensis]AJD89591.1 hypothetical protein JMA_02740 [Jeotgalibacillus malaysiensis]
MELLALYYKKYAGAAKASDYVEWACQHLYTDDPEVKKLASMRVKEQLNMFEIEQMFANVMKSLQLTAPSEKACVAAHIKSLHAQLVMPVPQTMQIVNEIYECTVAHDLFEEQMRWQEVSDIIDDFQYGDNQKGYTADQVKQMITAHARKLWHMKPSEMDVTALIGQRVTGIDSEIHFIIQLEQGAIIIECPWRIRNADVILLGETDIQSNQREWRAVSELLAGKTIEDVQLFEQCPLLIIQCGDVFIDVFHASAYFDGWTLTNEADFYVFSMHGGSIA